MTPDKKDYIERHRNWQDKATEQLSIANNFLLTISTGLLAFVFDKTTFSQLQFCFCVCTLNKKLTLYSLSLLFILLAIGTGIIVLISRLYDLRLTRHITLIRQRFYDKKEDKVTEQNKNDAVLSEKDFTYPTFGQRLNTIRKVLFTKIEFLTQDETSMK